MLTKLRNILFVILSIACNHISKEDKPTSLPENVIKPTSVYTIALPSGYERLVTYKNSFAYYLQHFQLNPDNTVYYFDGSKKANQTMQYAVLDLPIGHKDLMQCADAIMRLRAGYFFGRNEYNSIVFKSADRTYNFMDYLSKTEFTNSQKAFDSFMEEVFANCGTYNLCESLKPKRNINEMSIGDVFVKGGSPGHAMIVMDIAVNKQTNQKIYLLAQGYMPAQSIHIVINPINDHLSPWYRTDSTRDIITPGYIFKPSQLKCW